MSGKIIGIVILIIIAGGLFIPIGSPSHGNDTVAITYGETTYNNNAYKQMVNEYFEQNGNVNLEKADEKVITSNDVNRISEGISQRTYNSNQIFSCAMVDLTSNYNDIQVDVDPKITTVTPKMYKSALNSSGISKGHVIVTSPVTATGESALAGIMKAYETATGQLIPEEVKNAANNEIYTQSEVVNNTNLSSDDVATLVDKAKEEVAKENTTNKQTIINIVNNIASNNNIQISNQDINNLADSIQQTQSVQDKASNYQNQVSEYINKDNARSIFDMIWNTIQSTINRYVPQR